MCEGVTDFEDVGAEETLGHGSFVIAVGVNEETNKIVHPYHVERGSEFITEGGGGEREGEIDG